MPSAVPDKQSNRISPAFASLQNTQFRWLLASNLLYFLALNGQMLTRSVLAWQMTNDEMALAYINAAYALPMIVFALIGGALIDRFERRGLAQTGQLVLILNEAVIWLLLATGQLSFWHLIVAGIIGGVVNPVLMTARTSLTFNTVGSARLGNATALATAAVNISRVIGPVIMGAVVASISVAAAYVCSIVFLTLSYCGLFGVARNAVTQNTDSKPVSLLQDISAGLSYIKRTRPILICLVFGFLPASVAIPAQSLLILFADNVWQVGESGLGLLMASAGMGGVLGSFWVATRGENHKRVRPMVAAALTFTICLVLFSYSASFYLGLLLFGIATAGSSACMTLNNTALQLLVDDSRRGRVSSFMMMTYGFTPLGVLPLAWLAKHFGISLVMSAASIGLFITIIIFYWLSGSLRSLDKTVANVFHEASPRKK